MSLSCKFNECVDIYDLVKHSRLDHWVINYNRLRFSKLYEIFILHIIGNIIDKFFTCHIIRVKIYLKTLMQAVVSKLTRTLLSQSIGVILPVVAPLSLVPCDSLNLLFELRGIIELTVIAFDISNFIWEYAWFEI